jgi:ribosomal protein L13
MECLIKIYYCERIKLQDNFNNKATCKKEWIVVDDGHNLGRLASKVAMILEVSTSQVTHHTWTVEIT